MRVPEYVVFVPPAERRHIVHPTKVRKSLFSPGKFFRYSRCGFEIQVSDVPPVDDELPVCAKCQRSEDKDAES